MAILNTAQLRQALELSKHCDALNDQLAAVMLVESKDFSVDVYVNNRAMTMSMTRDLVEDQLRELVNNARGNLQALGITHVETVK